MSNSKNKMDVLVTRKYYNKMWAIVRLKRSREFIPSFEDLYRMIQAISYCEDLKYPRENGLKGRQMVAEFLVDAVWTPPERWGELVRKYNIPERCNSEVINDNGANLKD